MDHRYPKLYHRDMYKNVSLNIKQTVSGLLDLNCGVHKCEKLVIQHLQVKISSFNHNKQVSRTAQGSPFEV